MSSFVHVNQPVFHPGIARAEAAVDYIRFLGQRFDGARGLAALLLAAIVSSLLVVADKLMSSWSEGGLLVAWLVLWVVAFAALALFTGTARRLATRVIGAGQRMAARRAAVRADDEFLAFARLDPRIMGDLRAIASRKEMDAVEASVAAQPASPLPAAKPVATADVPTLHQALRRVNLGQYY